jgi:hypothetical protein
VVTVMDESELRAALEDVLTPPVAPVSVSDAGARIVQKGRRVVRRRRLLAASGAVAAAVMVVFTVVLSGVFDSPSTTITVTPASPAPTNREPVPVGGLVLGLDASRHFVIGDIGRPSHNRRLPVTWIAGEIATNPDAGWVVTYSRDAKDQAAGVGGLAIVDPSGATRTFGGDVAGSVTGLAVSPDGSRVALAVTNYPTAGAARIEVLAMPGHSAAPRSWTVDNQYDDKIISLSWNPAGSTLSYIAGTETGAGIGGVPSTLDTSLPGMSAPSAPAFQLPADEKCAALAASWLGRTEQFVAVTECGGEDRLSSLAPAQLSSPGRLSGPVLPGYGCAEHGIKSSPDGRRILVNQCGTTYLITDGHVTKVDTLLLGVTWAGTVS